MMATHGVSIGSTCLSRPRPTRKVQLITEVKCGTQPRPSSARVRNSSTMRGTLRKETIACNTSDTQNVRTCRASARSTTSVAAGDPSSFFSCDCLFQGADFRLQLRNFLLIASFRFPAFADFLGSLNGLTFPLVTTADNLRVLKHWMTGTHRGVDASGFLSSFPS